MGSVYLSDFYNHEKMKKDIVKSLGAMWSPRYYRWYLRADRLEKAANIIKKLA